MIDIDWSGEGLPPVGLEVEWMPSLQHGWQRVTVLAYSGDDAWIKQLGEPSTIVGNPANFRPIRTAEQIAADERLHKISNACTAIARTLDRFASDIPGGAAALAVIEAMIDAGYKRPDELAERAGQ